MNLINNIKHLKRKTILFLFYSISILLALIISLCNNGVVYVDLNKNIINGLVLIAILLAFILSAFFIKKWNRYVWHYLICLSIVLIAISNYNSSFIVVYVLTITFFLVSKIRWFYVIPLILFIVWAFFKRVMYLGDSCFWWDEFLTEMRVWFSSDQLLKEPMTARCLLYSYALKFYASTISLITNNNYLTEFQLRLPHAIAGTLSLYLFYLIGKNLKDKNTGLLMTAFGAISAFLVYFSREARFYPFVMLFSACLIHAVILIVCSKNECNFSKRIRYYIYYSFTAICGMHIHQGFWLLFVASNIFLASFELINVLFFSNNKKKDFLLLVPIFFLLILPICSVLPLINTLLDKGSESSIIKAQKLVPHLDNSFFVNIHRELWKGLCFRDNMFFVVLVSSIILLFFRKTRVISFYLLFVMIFTFLSLRNMGQFREPFRVKYITYIYLIEMIISILAFTYLVDFLLTKIKNNNISTLIYCLVLSLSLVLSQSDLIANLCFPKESKLKDSFRSIAETINENALPEDIVVSGDEGIAALQYFKRVFSASWNIIKDSQIESPYRGNYIYDGFVYCMFKRDVINRFNNNIFSELDSDSSYYLFKSRERLNKSIQNDLLRVLDDGFKNSHKLPIKRNIDKLYFTDNFIVNGEFTNKFDGWNLSNNGKDNLLINFISDKNQHYVSITNNNSKAFVISQTINVPTDGLYALTFKTTGFKKRGHLSVVSSEFNRDIYKQELEQCLFTRFSNFKFSKPQNVSIIIAIGPNDYCNIYNLGFFKLEKH